MGHFRVALYPYFDLHENGRVDETHFHMNGFARRLVLTQRQKVTWKWPINISRAAVSLAVFDIRITKWPGYPTNAEILQIWTD